MASSDPRYRYFAEPQFVDDALDKCIHQGLNRLNKFIGGRLRRSKSNGCLGEFPCCRWVQRGEEYEVENAAELRGG